MTAGKEKPARKSPRTRGQGKARAQAKKTRKRGQTAASKELLSLEAQIRKFASLRDMADACSNIRAAIAAEAKLGELMDLYVQHFDNIETGNNTSDGPTKRRSEP